MLSCMFSDGVSRDEVCVTKLHNVSRFIPYNRRTLTSLRCVSKFFRHSLQCKKCPWFNREEMIISRSGRYIVFNAHEDEFCRSSFSLLCVSPIDARFNNFSTSVLTRYHNIVADGLSKLCLHYCGIDNSFFNSIAPLCNLRYLELVSCRNVSRLDGASALSQLEHLEVMLCPLEADALRGLALLELRRLRLRSCRCLKSLNDVNECSAKFLQELCVENCEVEDGEVSNFFAVLSSTLRILNLSGTQVNRALTFINRNTLCALSELHMSNTPIDDNTMHAIMPWMRNSLFFLALENCYELQNYYSIGNLRALRFIDISGHYEPEGIESIRNCSKLELFRVADSSIQNIAFLAAKYFLRILDAPRSLLTNNMLFALKNLPSLDTVILSDCVDISDVNVLHTCLSLQRLFCKGTKVTDDGIFELCECKNLQELDLQNTLICNINFLLSCPSLTILNVRDTPIVESNIQNFLERPGLDVLYNCDNDWVL